MEITINKYKMLRYVTFNFSELHTVFMSKGTYTYIHRNIKKLQHINIGMK